MTTADHSARPAPSKGLVWCATSEPGRHYAPRAKRRGACPCLRCHWAALVVLLAACAAPATGGPAGPDAQRGNQRLFRAAARTVAPSVVRIETIGGAQAFGAGPPSERADSGDAPPQNPFRDDPGSSFRVADGPTTGLVHSADGYILTSSFNFVRDPVIITVILPDGRRFVADLVARDQVRKLALLKIEANNLPVPQWVTQQHIRVGQWVVALGRGLGVDEPFVSVGIVSALGRMLGNAVQTDAKLSPINYGGPLVDVRGRVLGICVPMAQRPGELAGVEMYDAGLGFAVPKQRVDEIVEVLRTGRSFYRGWLGMASDPTARDRVRIMAVADPSPLLQAGVESGDEIVAIEGRQIRHFGDLVQCLYMRPAGETVRLTVRRDEREFEVDVRLARAIELGPLPDTPPSFDPSEPLP